MSPLRRKPIEEIDYFTRGSDRRRLTEYLRNNVATMYGDWQFGGLNVCAKSGTAEHEGETADAMFAGFCVDENCPLAFVVFVENGGSGSAVAAPIAAKVLQVCAAAINR